MRQFWVFIIALCLAVPALAQDSPTESIKQPEKVSLVTDLKPGEVLRYNVKVQASGKATFPGASQPSPLDTTIELIMSYKVGQPDKDGSIQVTIAPEKASAVVGGQRMEIPNNLIPTSTVLFDKDGKIIRMFSSDAAQPKLPGLNSHNLILLFRPDAPGVELEVGAIWKKLISLPPDTDKYDMSYLLEAVEEVSGTRTARVKTDLKIVPAPGANYSSKGSAITNFALDTGRLVKAHAEMTVKTAISNPQPSDQITSDDNTSGQIDALVKIDVTQIQPLLTK
jgi:hypothetical protein